MKTTVGFGFIKGKIVNSYETKNKDSRLGKKAKIQNLIHTKNCGRRINDSRNNTKSKSWYYNTMTKITDADS